MTYRPKESVFGPPFAVRVPSFLYLAIAVSVAVVVLVAEQSPGSALYAYIVERDVHRIISSRTLAIVLFVSSLAAVIRASMRGVRVRGDGVEYRDVLGLGCARAAFRWPRSIGRARSAAYHRHRSVDEPRFRRRSAIGRARRAAEKVATARAIPVRGGRAWMIPSRRARARGAVDALSPIEP
jgi:hypothetical protein